jgi:transcriptional regulator with GAF, ATPase, and Fis domain
VGDPYEEALCHRLFARVHGLRGELEPFRQHAGEVIRPLAQMGERWEQGRTFMAIGDVWTQLGARLGPRWMEEAQAAYQRAETLALGLELAGDAAMVALRLAQLDRARGRLDQALARIGTALHEVGESEAQLRQDLVNLRGEVENAIAAGYGPTAAEREAFEEVTKLYSGRAEVGAVLDNLLGLVVQRSGSDRAFFAWGRPEAAPALRSAVGFRRGEGTRILGGLGQPLVAELTAAGRPLIATEPESDPRLAGVERRDATPLSVAILPFQIPGQVQGLVYVERAVGNDAGPYRAAEIALLAMLTNVVAIAAVESERARTLTEGVSEGELHPALAPIVTHNPEMRRILKLVERVAETPARVLLLGETGTGKGLLARAVHQLSPRAREPFLQVNVAALPESLLESELFGHVRGAFTGAVRDKRGLFEEAGAGTIFLDEVDKMSAAMQAKLLHVLDRQVVRMVGDTKWRAIACRVICAANVDLRELIRRGEFLEDLYYRLNEFAVVVPPLRDRPEDILPLASYFIERSASRMGRHPRGLDPEVERALLAHDWPGNVRELENTIERMVVLAEDDAPLGVDLLPEPLGPAAGDGFKSGTTLRQEIQKLEARVIGQALREQGWNKLRTARSLHLSYPALLKKIREYKLDRRKTSAPAPRRKNIYS